MGFFRQNAYFGEIVKIALFRFSKVGVFVPRVYLCPYLCVHAERTAKKTSIKWWAREHPSVKSEDCMCHGRRQLKKKLLEK
jgi:hypothetical protein